MASLDAMGSGRWLVCSVHVLACFAQMGFPWCGWRLVPPRGQAPCLLTYPPPALPTPWHPFTRSNFYERLKEVREYHRKFPNDDLTEVRAAEKAAWALGQGGGKCLIQMLRWDGVPPAEGAGGC